MSSQYRTPVRLHLAEDTTLIEAKNITLDAASEPGGVMCPCCEGLAIVYRRHLQPLHAEVLLHMAAYDQSHPGEWIDMGDFREARKWINGRNVTSGGEWAKLKHWSLIEEGPDGWRITPAGILFAAGKTTVPARLLVFQGIMIGEEPGCGQVSIRDTTRSKFDPAEIYTPTHDHITRAMGDL